MPNVKEIVENYLRAEGFDGLCNPDIECQCWLKNGPEIMNCSDSVSCEAGPVADCVPGHKALRDDGDWVIGPGKPECDSEKTPVDTESPRAREVWVVVGYRDDWDGIVGLFANREDAQKVTDDDREIGLFSVYESYDEWQKTER